MDGPTRRGTPRGHVCSPACLAILDQRLVELPDALDPVSIGDDEAEWARSRSVGQQSLTKCDQEADDPEDENNGEWQDQHPLAPPNPVHDRSAEQEDRQDEVARAVRDLGF